LITRLRLVPRFRMCGAILSLPHTPSWRGVMYTNNFTSPRPECLLEPNQPPIQWVPKAFYSGIKRTECEGDHLPPPPYFSSSTALRPVFGPRPPRCRDFETIQILRGEYVSPSPNPNLDVQGIRLCPAPSAKPVRHG
jgi:hypothetical protein